MPLTWISDLIECTTPVLWHSTSTSPGETCTADTCREQGAKHSVSHLGSHIFLLASVPRFGGGKLSRKKKKTFANFRGFVAICDSFLCEIWECGVFRHSKSEQSVKVFSTKIVFFTNSRKFSPSKVYRYMVPKSSPSQCGGGYCLGFFCEAHGGPRN